jgi:hypothetical protein
VDAASTCWQAIGRTSGDLICSAVANDEDLARTMVGRIERMSILASEPLLLRLDAIPPRF